MSRQHSNRPFIPSRRRVSQQMYDSSLYTSSSTDDTPLPPNDSSTEPSNRRIQNNNSYSQYSQHPRMSEPALLGSNQRTHNNDMHPSEIVHSSNSSLNSHYLPSYNREQQSRPSLPFSLVTAAATTTASAPHHRHYRLENPSAAAFTRHPPWFDDEAHDMNGTVMQRSSRPHNDTMNNHSKRQRSSATSTPTSQTSSQPYQHRHHHHHHHERKRSRHEGTNDGTTRENYRSHENVLQPPPPPPPPTTTTTGRSSSHHHYQPYPTYRHFQTQPNPLPRTFYNEHASSFSRAFDQRSQGIQRNRMDHFQEPHNTHTHHESRHPLPLVLESPPLVLPRRQMIPSSISRSSSSAYTQQPHQQRAGLTIETHSHQRPSSFLTDLLHRVIDAHAASYSDNHVHYHHHHHHHPPSASIDLIAYAWMSPIHDIFTLPGAFSIQFGDFFDLTMPDETPVVGLTDSELERLPTMIFTKSCTNIEDDDKCAVCLSEYIGGDKLKRLRCKHFFHSECIDPWLKTSTRCPICRGEQTS